MARLPKQRTMRGPFEIVVKRDVDVYANPPEVDASNYEGEPSEDIARYIADDQKRLDAYNRNEWCYLVLGVELRLQNRMNWAVWTTVGRAYLSSVESDSDDSYIQEEIDSLTREAEADAEATYQALRQVFDKTEVQTEVRANG